MRTWIVGIVAAGIIAALAFFAGSEISSRSAAKTDAELESAREQIAALNEQVTNAEDRIWLLYREREALREQLEGREAGSGEPTATAARGVFGDGVHLVDEDMAPGDYDGRVTGEFGYWARLKSTDGTVNSIIANEIVRGPFTVTVLPTDRAVELQGVELTAR